MTSSGPASPKVMSAKAKSLPAVSPVVSRLLERSQQQSAPVSLRAVVSLWPKLQVSFDELDGEAYLLDLGAHGGEIVVNSKRPVTRMRFSIGHELGHWYLHQHGYPLVPDVDADKRSFERWCDRFAAEMLMPRSWIAGELDGASTLDVLDVVPRLPWRYRVSKSAMYIRLSELGRVSVFECVERGTTMRVAENYCAHTGQRGVFAGLTKAMSILRCPDRKLIESNGFMFAHRIVRRDPTGRTWLVVAMHQRGKHD